jgi:hypothetical protein
MSWSIAAGHVASVDSVALVMSHHPAWRCGRYEIAAGGGADRRSAKIAAAPLPRGRPIISRRFRTWRQEVALSNPSEGEGCHLSKQAPALKPLTWAFAPLAGLEPAPYGLEVRHDLSAWCCHGASPQVGSGPSSNPSQPGEPCYSDRIAREIASRTEKPLRLARLPSAEAVGRPQSVSAVPEHNPGSHQ